MKLSDTVVISALCWTAPLAAAATAHVYVHDPQSQPASGTTPRSLEPVSARLVLAQRAGVEDYHSADLSRQEVIEAINEYGVRTPLFAAADKSSKKAFILLEGEDNSLASVPSLRSYRSFELDPSPAKPATRALFVDLAKQSLPKQYLHLDDDEVFAQLYASRATSGEGDCFHVTKSAADFEAVFDRLVKEKSWSITAMVTPSGVKSSAGETKYQWGTYTMPGAQSPLKKRQQTKEEPLSLATDYEPVQSSSSTPPSTFDANNTEPLRGILPACFSTQSACESATRNCTGHGSCSKKYHDRTAGKSGMDCYSCSCKATKSSDGKKTTKWGGPACQKKDVSIEFWLIVLFTVGMIFVIGFAIGTIWEMGSEELPSVIGAGVSGPTARK
ncbi:endoplasmic reticulum membrane [Lecanosticta acicola]|uniref:Endoplasmic reticulum membrane n=1 Tax=Lecanosticta acicola TaxID=111012 RepID=A0AAI9EEI4_9PEZI|nr:endoplasmic reticulum membrane [Lecanosticta acicola]